MGPYQRTEAGADAIGAAEPDAREAHIADTDISAPEYRRVGRAMATVVVKVGSSRPLTPAQASARMRVRSPAASLLLDPALATCEAPGSEHEEHRLWFLMDLSLVISGDTTFALVVDDFELPLPGPQPRASWSTGDNEPIALDSAWSESELRAIVSALEERCRVAERSAADLRATLESDPQTSDHTSRLTNAWREVEVLQELLDTRESAYRALKDVLDAAAAERDARDAQIKIVHDELERARREAVIRDDALSSEVERARERAADGRRLAEAVEATLRQVQAERQELLDKTAAAVAELERERAARAPRLPEPVQSRSRSRRRGGLLARLQLPRAQEADSHTGEPAQTQRRTESELQAQLEETRHELAAAEAALREMRARFGGPDTDRC
jgi:hypothetical protein